MRRASLRVVLAGLLVTALALAGVASFYASQSPDGLERVAQDQGFGDTAEDHVAGEGPMADYRTAGVDEPRLSGGIAGVVGALVVLVVAGGISYAVRRRPDTASERSSPPTADRH